MALIKSLMYEDIFGPNDHQQVRKLLSNMLGIRAYLEFAQVGEEYWTRAVLGDYIQLISKDKDIWLYVWLDEVKLRRTAKILSFG